jgi:PTH1 family peptidyl-tRNA hydrolase
MKLFVGLGNPGAKYAGHRHNVGFMTVERLAERHRFGPWRRRFQGLASDGELNGEKVLLLKPETYMNESGRAVGEAARFLKIATSDIVVFHDELDLLPGKLKVKSGGGNAGHNGLRSITAHLDNEYMRVRLGIGHPGAKELVQAWVLHDFSREDQDWLEPLLDAIADAAPRLAAGDAQRFMTDVARVLDQSEEAPPLSTSERRPERAPAERVRHPTGERGAKRATALADNLRNWLAKRKPKD